MNRSKEPALPPPLSPRERENPAAAPLVIRTPQSTQRELEPRYLGCYEAAFTLIEMLVVISIIGILAALIIGVMPAVNEKQIRSKVSAEREAVESAIERYKLDKGFYPPDNTLFTNFPSLYYELQGFDVPAVPPSIKIQAQ